MSLVQKKEKRKSKQQQNQNPNYKLCHDNLAKLNLFFPGVLT